MALVGIEPTQNRPIFENDLYYNVLIAQPPFAGHVGYLNQIITTD